jgi:intracellular sulfur oxidation DsrE/DsrF family protein
MKPYIILLIALITFRAVNLNAQSVDEIKRTEQSIQKKGKYAMLVMKSQHLKAAIKTGIEFKTKSSKIDFQIVTCGELVKEISQDQELQKIIVSAVILQGLKILICGLSIEQLKVDRTLLPKETGVTENGLIYMFGLLEEGFKTITL